jgi:hypothetical protein
MILAHKTEKKLIRADKPENYIIVKDANHLADLIEHDLVKNK